MTRRRPLAKARAALLGVALLSTTLVGAGLSMLAPAAARAEEPPPEVAALAGEDVEQARTALLAHPEAGALVARTLRDAEAFDTLSAEAKAALLDTVESVDSGLLNSGLRRVLRDGAQTDDIRRRTVIVLGTRGGVADVAALEGALAEFTAEAAMALGQVGGRSAEVALRRHAGDDAHPAVLAALGRFGDADALRSLVTHLGGATGAEAEWIGSLLVWATGRDLAPDRKTWEAHLRRRALAHQIAHPELERASDAVRELTAVLASRTSSTLEPDLIAILSDARWGPTARCGAALILGRAEARGARDALLAVCGSGEVGQVRLYAAEALAFVGDLSIAVPFADILVHDEDLDRIRARRTSTGEYFPVDPGMARTLFRLGCPGAAEPLLELLAGEYRTRMHRDTLRALRELTGGEDFLYEADSAKPQRQAAAAAARSWWAEARDTSDLPRRADDAGWETFRTHVAERIERLGTFKFLHQLRAKKALVIVAEPALPQIIEALSHANLHVRMGAAEVLTLARLREAAAPLAARLGVEENPAARSKLVVALEACGRPTGDGTAVDAEIARAVRSAATDRSIDVRISATRALGVVGDVTTDAPALRKALTHPIDALRSAAAGALVLLGDRSGLGVLCDELASDDVARRATAADVLSRGGVDLHGYDADATAEERSAATQRIRGVSQEER